MDDRTKKMEDFARIKAGEKAEAERFLRELIAATPAGEDKVHLMAAAKVVSARMLKDFSLNQSPEKSLREASLCQMLGGVFWQLDDLESAATVLRKAKEWRTAYLPGSHPGELSLLAETLYSFAVVSRALGNAKESETVLHQILDMTRPSLGECALDTSDPLLIDALNLLGLLCADRKEWVDADTRHREALALARRIEPNGGWRTVRSLRYLASIFERLGQSAAAEPLFTEAANMAAHLPAATEAGSMIDPDRPLRK